MYIFLYDCEQTFGAEVKQPQSGRPRCAMLLISLPKEVLDRITLMASLDDGVRWYPVVGVISAIRATCADSRELCRFSTVCHRVEERILNRNRVSVEVWSLMVDGVRQSVGVRIAGPRFADCLWTVVLYRWRTVGGCLGNTMFRQFIHRVCVRQNHSAGGWDIEPVGVPFELGTQPGTWVVGRESRRWHPAYLGERRLVVHFKPVMPASTSALFNYFVFDRKVFDEEDPTVFDTVKVFDLRIWAVFPISSCPTLTGCVSVYEETGGCTYFGTLTATDSAWPPRACLLLLYTGTWTPQRRPCSSLRSHQRIHRSH